MPGWSQPADVFTDAPAVIALAPLREEGEPNDAPGYSRLADQYEDSEGYILRKLIKSRLRGIEVGRICLVAFSAGGTFASRVLAGPDARHLDSVIMLDALHLAKKPAPGIGYWTESTGPWVDFGVRAARAEATSPLCIHSVTGIASPSPFWVGSTSESSAEVMRQVRQNSPQAPRIGYPPDLLAFEPPPPAVTVTAGAPRVTKTWDQYPVPGVTGIGDCWMLDYGGVTGADHALQPWFVQRNLLRAFLAVRWNDWSCAPGADDAAACTRRGVLPPPGLYESGESPPWGAAAAGLVLGGFAGWWFGRWKR